jgi:hypothetical protein
VLSTHDSEIHSELAALCAMSTDLINGKEMRVDYSIDIDMGDEEITVIQIVRDGIEYMMTCEGKGQHAKIVLRSLQVPELLVSLPAPIYMLVGEELLTRGGEVC